MSTPAFLAAAQWRPSGDPDTVDGVFIAALRGDGALAGTMLVPLDPHGTQRLAPGQHAAAEYLSLRHAPEDTDPDHGGPLLGAPLAVTAYGRGMPPTMRAAFLRALADAARREADRLDDALGRATAEALRAFMAPGSDA